MSASDAKFTGSIPRLYDEHMGPGMFTPYAHDMAARLSNLATGHVLETASGTGILTQRLAATLPDDVAITATDLNQAMLDLAVAKPGLERVQFQLADAQALPFPDESFDAVICQFGIMFFPDRRAGMREALRVLRPGGRFLFSVWGPIEQNLMIHLPVQVMQARYPQQPDWFPARTPCGYHQEDLIRTDLKAAGFPLAKIEDVRLQGHFRNAESIAIAFCQGTPMRAEIEALDPDGLAAATEAAAVRVAAELGSGPITVSMHVRVIETMKPDRRHT